MSALRKVSFQPDVLEWVRSQGSSIGYLQKERAKLESGFVDWFKWMFANFSGPTPQDIKTEEAKTKERLATEQSAKAMNQYYESEELIKAMKWKRVTWDDEADYATFAQRVLDNDSMFKKAPAFSFMSIHVVKDPATSDLVALPKPVKLIEPGALTGWVLQERDPAAVELYPTGKTVERRSAFKVDWTAGAVYILDTASAQEILTFLSTGARRLQAVQVKMEAQQQRITQNVEYVRVRSGITVKYNEFDTTFWDDPRRLTDRNYITPDQVEKCLDSLLRSAVLYRWFLKGQQVRIMPPGSMYFADLDQKEIQIPCNFEDYNWLRAHGQFERVEKIATAFRRFWWFWFALGMIVVGDVELL